MIHTETDSLTEGVEKNKENSQKSLSYQIDCVPAQCRALLRNNISVWHTKETLLTYPSHSKITNKKQTRTTIQSWQ